MKSILPLKLAMASIIALGVVVVSCKKDSTAGNNSTATTTSLQTQADDQSMTSTENEAVTNDVNTTLVSQVSTNGNSHPSSIASGTTSVNSLTKVNGISGVNNNLICDASVVYDSVSNPRTFTITYNGTNCWGNRSRTGTVVVSIAQGVLWLDQGAAVTVNIQNLKITRLHDNKVITLNGYKTVTNTSGGSLKDLATHGSITHNIKDSLSILFADNTKRIWQSAKQRVFSYSNGIVITTTGTYSDGINTGIADWGVNREGVNFTSIITQPMVIRQDCDFRLVSGQAKILRTDSLTTTVTFGLDASGNATGCPGTGNYYLLVLWVSPTGKSYPLILPY